MASNDQWRVFARGIQTPSDLHDAFAILCDVAERMPLQHGVERVELLTAMQSLKKHMQTYALWHMNSIIESRNSTIRRQA